MRTVALGFDTTTEACSVALFDGRQMHSHRFLHTREHVAKLLPMIQELIGTAGIARSALDCIAFTRGPGSFSGCRIGTAAAQALGVALDRPLVPVSTLEALAEGAKRELGATRVATALDARMNQVYWACYERQGANWRSSVEESVSDPERVIPPLRQSWVGVGSGWAAHAPALRQRCPSVIRHFDKQAPDARDCVYLALPRYRRGDVVSPERAEPVYLRDKVALTTAERERKQPG